MAPKRAPSSAATAGPSTPRKKQRTQTTLAAFFSPPSRKAAVEVIDLVDSDSDSGADAVQALSQVESDAAMARRLAEEWGSGEAGKEERKGKGEIEGKDKEKDVVNGRGTSDIGKGKDKVTVDVAVEEVKVITDIAEVPDSPPRVETKPKPVHPMFQPRAPTKPAAATVPKPAAGPSRPTKVFGEKSSSASAPAIDFDTDSLLFRPHTVDTSLWPKGRLPYSVLVGVYVQVASTRSRLTIVRVLTNFLHLLMVVSPQDLAPALYLLSNHLRPAYLPCELGVGSMVLSKAIKEVSGLQAKDLKLLWSKYGDPGDVAYEAKSNLRTLVPPAPLVAHDVYARLLSLASITGPQSGKIKGDVVRKLMVQARGDEVRYLVRSLIGNLRIGAVRLTLLTALARAAALKEYDAAKLDAVLPVPDKGKKPADPAREAAEKACAEAVRLVRRVYVRHPNYGDLVAGLLQGLDGLETRVPLSVGIPISPMLGSITRSIDEVYARLGALPFTAEEKLDGQRLQMHVRVDGPQGEEDGGGRWVRDGDQRVWVRLFSRHLEDMTEKYPDVCSMALKLVSRVLPAKKAPFPPSSAPPDPRVADLLASERVTSLILDAEIVAIDKDTGAKRTFQELTNRAKKDVKVEDIKVVVQVCAFDLMLLNDVPLLSSSFVHRRHLLRTLLPRLATSDPLLARFAHVDSVDSADLSSPADLRAFFDKVVERKAEGLMVKLLEGERGAGEEAIDIEEEDVAEGKESKAVKGKDEDKSRKKPLPATYEPDQRSMGWLKVKKDYLEGLGDSLDLVPIGAWWGMGRKAGWWSPILLAARNPDSGALEAVCKCISGFTDAFYKDLLVQYPPEGSPEICNPTTPLGYVETGGLVPDVWFLPREVWEIRGADITLSPVYTAGAAYIGGERGLSIRFPRFIRKREDKTVDEATTSEDFAEMFRRQMARPAGERAVPVEGSDEEGGGELGDGEGEGEGELDEGGLGDVGEA